MKVRRSTDRSSRIAMAAALLLPCAGWPVHAAPVPLGDELRVDASGAESFAAPAMDAAGEFLVVWEQPGRVAVRGFASDGAPLGPEIAVDADVPNLVGAPDAAATDDGRFLVAWTGYAPPISRGGTGSLTAQARVLDVDGQNPTPRFRLGGSTLDEMSPPTVASDGSGFVVAWLSDYRPRARRMDADGAPVGAEIDLDLPGAVPTSVALAAWPGAFATVWVQGGFEDQPLNGRRFASDGTALAEAFQISPPSYVNGRGVAALGDGRFVVAWSDDGGLRTSAFAANGAPVTAGHLLAPGSAAHIAAAPDGPIVASWRGESPPRAVLRAQQLGADGLALGPARQISQSCVENRFRIGQRVAVSAAGHAVVTWSHGDEIRARLLSLIDDPPSTPVMTLGLDACAYGARPANEVRLGFSLRNDGPTVNADVYLGLILPGGAWVAWVRGVSPPSFALRPSAWSPALAPRLAAGFPVPTGTDIELPELLAVELLRFYPAGEYVALARLTRPGALLDGSVDPGDVIDEQRVSFDFDPSE